MYLFWEWRADKKEIKTSILIPFRFVLRQHPAACCTASAGLAWINTLGVGMATSPHIGGRIGTVNRFVRLCQTLLHRQIIVFRRTFLHVYEQAFKEKADIQGSRDYDSTMRATDVQVGCKYVDKCIHGRKCINC